MSYFKWFLLMGWKQYALAFAIGAGITIAVLMSWQDVIMAPLPIAFLIPATILGFDAGIVIHSIINYRANKG